MTNQTPYRCGQPGQTHQWHRDANPKFKCEFKDGKAIWKTTLTCACCRTQILYAVKPSKFDEFKKRYMVLPEFLH